MSDGICGILTGGGVLSGGGGYEATLIQGEKRTGESFGDDGDCPEHVEVVLGWGEAVGPLWCPFGRDGDEGVYIV